MGLKWCDLYHWLRCRKGARFYAKRMQLGNFITCAFCITTAGQ
uniref:Uncharacterized protein n=1 Tax=Arundo donax TaxID=35708 RepID=A0A0A9ASG7_ARUDO